MTTLRWVLACWLVLSFPVSLLIGRHVGRRPPVCAHCGAAIYGDPRGDMLPIVCTCP